MQVRPFCILLLVPVFGAFDLLTEEKLRKKNFQETFHFGDWKEDIVRYLFEQHSHFVCSCNNYTMAFGTISYSIYNGTGNLHERYSKVYQIRSIPMYVTVCNFLQGRSLQHQGRYRLKKYCFRGGAREKRAHAILIDQEKDVKERFKLLFMGVWDS
ncbi:hypothetical protein ElyMa_001089000 [Elysia marginata]|uniref:Uncharacterized protein n=1 Tax=Elysia marginata TaxID=1093978 RepID=A0AAV4HSH5_9GAST|nr:hypothetical protein ElyMa_001089000 [Elysia marginata]